MKNLPFFTTQYGVASLTLDQIPYTRSAYITIQSTQDPEKLIGECADFCRAVGAEKIYACNHDSLRQFPLHTDVVEMEAEKKTLPKSSANLLAVTEATADEFCRIYNEKMRDVKTAGYMTRSQISRENAYFVYDKEVMIGIGIIKKDTLCAVASLRKGAGKDVLCALCRILDSDVVRLEVASENKKAMTLYNSLGFQQKAVINSWYKIV